MCWVLHQDFNPTLQPLFKAGIITFLRLTKVRFEMGRVEIPTQSEWLQKGRGGFQTDLYYFKIHYLLHFGDF